MVGPSVTCSVVLVVRVRAVQAGLNAEAEFPGAGLGPQGCPRAAVLQAQDGRAPPQTKRIRDRRGAWNILIHLAEPVSLYR